MKKIFFLLLFLPFFGFAQVTETQTNTDINTVRISALAPDKIAKALQDLMDNKATAIAYPTSGTNTYTVSINAKIVSYTTGLTIPVFFNIANTAPATLSVNGLPAKALVKNVSTALSSGDLPIGLHWCYYDGTNFRVSLPGSGGGGGSVNSVSGTTNRLTSTGGTDPILDVSTSFEGLLGKVANPLSQFSSTTSSQLAGVISDEIGTGNLVYSISPALTGNPTVPTQSPADNSTKIANTAYVDAAIVSQRSKEAAKYASTAALPTLTYSNGASGVGATLTETGLGALSIDGNTPSINDRVLIKNQVSALQNGIYVVTTVGSGAASFVLTRATDFDQAADIKTGDAAFVSAGSTLTSTTWAYNGSSSPVMGTDPITIVQTAGQGSFTSGNGISIVSTSIAIDPSVTVDKTTAQTLTNKTLTNPVLTTPTLGTPGSADFSSGSFTWPTFNQNTTGSAATWTTARNIAGNSVSGSANVPFSNKFIVQGTTDSGLSGAQFLGALGNGLVKNTNSTGVLSIAVSGTDYQAPLVSGTNIKTINSTSLLGSGDIAISAAPGGSTTQIQVNSSSSFNGYSNFTFDGSLLKLNAIANTYAGKTIVFLGNSLTAGSLASPSNLKFSTRLSSYYGATESNFGAAGSRADQVTLSNIPTYSSSYLWLVIEYGINDIAFGTTASTFANTYINAIITNATGKGWPASSIIILSIPGSYQSAVPGGVNFATGTSYNSATLSLCNSTGAIYIDISTPFYYTHNLLNGDVNHPNNLGHDLIYTTIKSVMKSNTTVSGTGAAILKPVQFDNLSFINAPYIYGNNPRPMVIDSLGKVGYSNNLYSTSLSPLTINGDAYITGKIIFDPNGIGGTLIPSTNGANDIIIPKQAKIQSANTTSQYNYLTIFDGVGAMDFASTYPVTGTTAVFNFITNAGATTSLQANGDILFKTGALLKQTNGNAQTGSISLLGQASTRVMSFNVSAATGLTTTTEFSQYDFAGASYTWAAGTIPVQRFGRTHSSTVVTGLASDAYAWFFEAPTGNITRAWSVGVDGNLQVQGKGYFGATVTAPTAWIHTAAGTTASPSALFAEGVAPTSPTDGMFWTESANHKIVYRQNGSSNTVQTNLVGRSTAQTSANASVATLTVGSNDGTFEVSADVLVTTATTHAFTVTVAYTDEGNTARTTTMNFSLVAGGAFTTSIANANGAVPYMGMPIHIRCKAGTSITVATTGTFTTVTYNVEGRIAQIN